MISKTLLKYLKVEIFLLTSALLVFFFTKPLLAAPPEESDEGPQGIGKIKIEELFLPEDINEVIGRLVQLAFAVAGIAFFFMLVLGGIRYITAGGDEKAAASARNTLTQAVIGLIIVVAAFLVTQLLFSLFGIESFINIG